MYLGAAGMAVLYRPHWLPWTRYGAVAAALARQSRDVGEAIVGDVFTQSCALREEGITHSLGLLQYLGVLTVYGYNPVVRWL